MEQSKSSSFIYSPLILILVFIGWGFNLVSWAFFLAAFIGNSLVGIIVGFLLVIFGTTAGVILEGFVFVKGDLPSKLLLLINPLPLTQTIYAITTSCGALTCNLLF
jgi:hypothetical protein